MCKKIISILTVIIMIIMIGVLSSCGDNSWTANGKTTTSEKGKSKTTSSTDTGSTTKPLPKYVPGSIKLNPINTYEENTYLFGNPTYRSIYYSLSGTFTDLSSNQNAVDKWIRSSDAKVLDTKKEPTEMILVSFVKEFKIKREDFEKAAKWLEEFYIQEGFDVKNERYEIPNTDIIYTFDNKIINEYYLRH